MGKDRAGGELPGIRASDVKAREAEFLWRHRIAKANINLIAGKPDTGKSLTASLVAADVSRTGHNVIYSAIEDAHDVMTRPRLEAAGANLDRIALWPFGLPEQFDELRAAVLNNDVALVVIDPFNAHLTSGVSRFTDSVRRVTTPLFNLAQESKCAVLIVEHAIKRISPNAHPLSAIGGSSSGLQAAARMGFIFGIDPQDGDRRILACVKHNLRDKPQALAFEADVDELPMLSARGRKVERGVPSLIVEGECEFDAMRLLVKDSDGKPGRSPDKRANAAEWLTMYLHAAGKPIKASQVIEDAKQFAHASRTIRRAAADLEIVKDPPGGGRSCTWDLPDTIKDILNEDGGS